MAVSAVSILARVSILLQDVTNIRWPQAELLDWLNDGQREVALFKPNACVRNVDVLLNAGTKQAIPADGVALIDIPRNTNGYSIRITPREVLDAQMPNWHSPTLASNKIVHYCYSPLDPKNFYVYPAAKPGTSVEIIYAANPANATLTGPISIDDVFASALVDYIAYRAWSKDSDFAGNANATNHRNYFLSAVAGKNASESATNPNVK